MSTVRHAIAGLALGAVTTLAAAQSIDNSAIGKPEFREHKATYGLVYRLPKDVNDVLDNKIYPPLREFYRISLENGTAWDVTSGKPVALGK